MIKLIGLMVKLSIIICAYNVDKFIDDCINSISVQLPSDCEIIIIDDCSTDNTFNAITKHISKNVFVYRNQKNLGLSISRNKGLKHAKGQFIAFVDGDDLLSFNFFDTINNNLKYDIFLFGFTKCDIAASKVIEENRCHINGLISKKNFWKLIYFAHPEIATSSCTKIYKRTIFNDISFKENVINEDAEILHKIIYKSSNIYISNKSLYIYRKRSDSITNSTMIKSCKDLFNALYNRMLFFEETHNYKMKSVLYEMLALTRNAYINQNFFYNDYIYYISIIRKHFKDKKPWIIKLFSNNEVLAYRFVHFHFIIKKMVVGIVKWFI